VRLDLVVLAKKVHVLGSGLKLRLQVPVLLLKMSDLLLVALLCFSNVNL